MKNLQKLLLFVIGLVTVLGFQNCFDGRVDSGANRAGQDQSRQLLGGQPYDGKPYIKETLCPDQTVVEARLMLSGDGGGTLYRASCQNVAARPISSQEIQVTSVDRETLRYNGDEYHRERPSLPLPGVISWVYQLTGSLIERSQSSIYVVDLFETSAEVVAALKTKGHIAICSVSAGTVENWRPDADQFLRDNIGNRAGSGEFWVNYRAQNVKDIMAARLDLAKSKGCHGVDFDSVDGYGNDTGFGFSAAEQIDYNRFLAFAAHDRKLILSLNNAPELADALSVIFDFVIAEQCFENNECDSYGSFIRQAKPVLVAEYRAYNQQLCDQALTQSLSLIFMSSKLDGTGYQYCE